MDSNWTAQLDFIAHFEEHQIEQIRRAVISYRERYSVGDVTLAREIRKLITKNPDAHDAILKNVQRLRKGERITGTAFLNACVQFLQVKLAEPTTGPSPEEDLAEAMGRFVGPAFRESSIWKQLAGDYAVRILGINHFRPLPRVGHPLGMLRGMPIATKKAQEEFRSTTIMSIRPREGSDYATVRERYLLTEFDEASEPEPPLGDLSLFRRTGVCMPIGSHEFVVMLRDFLFSHLYVLRLHQTGFVGTMLMPDQVGFTGPDILSQPQRMFDVALRKLQSD
jgi:hypothetical protein